MADVTKCSDEYCPKKNTCYRYQAPSNPYWQSYFIATPREQDDSCKEYVPTKEKTNEMFD